MQYMIVTKPNHNIAFLDQYLTMCQVELTLVLKAHGMDAEDVSQLDSGKGKIISFAVASSLSGKVLRAIHGLSFFYMLFQVMDGGMLKPVDTEVTPVFGDDLSIRLKYNGKTNETITRMMINIALSVSDYSQVDHPRLLDPLCGRGTTLFEGMISGYDVYGVDRDQKGIGEMGTFITRYVKEQRLKHTNKHGKLVIGGRHIGDMFELQYAKEKSDYKAGRVREMKVFRGDTTEFEGAFRHRSMDLLIADFPYNIQHRGKGGDKDQKGLAWLLEAGLKSWHPFLKKGAGLALSWNVYTDKREVFVKVLSENGFTVIEDNGLDGLEHRVAQAITRDIIVAKKD